MNSLKGVRTSRLEMQGFDAVIHPDHDFRFLDCVLDLPREIKGFEYNPGRHLTFCELPKTVPQDIINKEIRLVRGVQTGTISNISLVTGASKTLRLRPLKRNIGQILADAQLANERLLTDPHPLIQEMGNDNKTLLGHAITFLQQISSTATTP